MRDLVYFGDHFEDGPRHQMKKNNYGKRKH